MAADEPAAARAAWAVVLAVVALSIAALGCGAGGQATPAATAPTAVTTPGATSPTGPSTRGLVPDLVGRTIAAAQVLLDQAGLVFGPHAPLQVPPGDVRAGTIVEQVPAGGEPAEEGRPVRIVVAVAAAIRPAPRVIELSLDEANALLRAEGFALGMQLLGGDPPSGDAIIQNQFPAAGTLVAAGTVIDVSFRSLP